MVRAYPRGSEIGQLLRDLAAEHFLPPDECGPFERAVVTVERRFAELFAEWYSDQWDAYREALGDGWDESPLPRYVELPFGDVPLRGEERHPHAQPFAVFGAGEDQVRVQGQIDRIDVGRRDNTTAFAVIDYKTRSGERFDLKDVRAGLALQLAIYVSALRQSKLLGPDPGLFQMLYWNLTRNGCVSALEGGRSKRMEPIDAAVVCEIEGSLHDLLPRMAGRLPRRRVSRPQRRPQLHGLLPLQHRLPRQSSPLGGTGASETLEPHTAMSERAYTSQQTAAITNRAVSIGLSAGAGCGKTFVLTERFLSYLAPQANEAKGAAESLSQIVAITFTDRAAREMRDRIRSACLRRLEACAESDVPHWLSILRSIDGARISTIHSFCAAFLRRHAVAAGVDPEFGLLEAEMGRVARADVDFSHDQTPARRGKRRRHAARRPLRIGGNGSHFDTALGRSLDAGRRWLCRPRCRAVRAKVGSPILRMTFFLDWCAIWANRTPSRSFCRSCNRTSRQTR